MRVSSRGIFLEGFFLRVSSRGFLLEGFSRVSLENSIGHNLQHMAPFGIPITGFCWFFNTQLGIIDHRDQAFGPRIWIWALLGQGAYTTPDQPALVGQYVTPPPSRSSPDRAHTTCGEDDTTFFPLWSQLPSHTPVANATASCTTSQDVSHLQDDASWQGT